MPKEVDYLTTYRKPSSEMTTLYGTLTYLDWCNAEVKRLNARKDGRLAWVEVNNAGEVCVARETGAVVAKDRVRGRVGASLH